MLVKVKWYETLMLLVVMVALFRPGFVMDQFFPSFEAIEIDRFVAGDVIAEPGQSVRLHVTRSTDYGDRFKLFQVTTPAQAEPVENFTRYGVSLEWDEEDNAYYVVDMQFNGLLEQAGLDFGDKVTKIDVAQTDVPAKQWVYPFALLLLGGVIALQWKRKKTLPGS